MDVCVLEYSAASMEDTDGRPLFRDAMNFERCCVASVRSKRGKDGYLQVLHIIVLCLGFMDKVGCSDDAHDGRLDNAIRVNDLQTESLNDRQLGSV